MPKNHTNATTNYIISKADEVKEDEFHKEYPGYIEHEPYMGDRLAKYFK